MRRQTGRLVAGAVIAIGAVALLGAAGLADGAKPKQAARPNVVVIETDDQTASTLSAMPNVQRLLVAQGVTFESSFATWRSAAPRARPS